MAKKKEGADVRHAFTGPEIEHDQFIAFAAARNEEDAERASSAGESRQKIGEFLEETGMNGKAASWLRQIMKQKKTDKAADIIASLEKGLPMVKNHMLGQSTPDMFETSTGVPAPVEPLTFDPTGDDEIDDETDAFLADVEDDNVVPFEAGAA